MVFFVDSHESVLSFVTINSNAGKTLWFDRGEKVETKKNEGEDKMEKSKIPST